jgi:hypothetical protein
MLARIQPFFRPIAMLDATRIDAIVTSSRAKRALAQAVMVSGYVALIFNPLDGSAMMLGLLCQAVAVMLHVSSKQLVTEIKTSR